MWVLLLFLSMMSKHDLLQQCIIAVKSKLRDIQEAFEQANQAMWDETKSSAGDKYETSREMIQQDIDRLQKQLNVLHKDLTLLTGLQDKPVSPYVTVGSLVITQRFTYFVAVSLGKIIIEDQDVYVISSQSPIGNLLIGKQIGETFEFQGREDKIQQIL